MVFRQIDSDYFRREFNQKIIEIDTLYSLQEKEKNSLLKDWQKAQPSDESWEETWCNFAKSNAATLAARYVLNKKRAKKDKIASSVNAEAELARDVKKHLAESKKYFKACEESLTKEQVEGFHNAALNYFKQHNTGQAAKMLIESLKRPLFDQDHVVNAKKWRNPLHFSKMLALSLWEDRTRSYLSELESKPAALAEPIFKQMANIMTKENSLNSKGNFIINASGDEIVKFEFEAARSVLSAGIPLLSCTTAYHVVTWLLCQVHKQFLMKDKNPRRIVLKGNAYERLGELSGAGVHPSTIDKIRKIIPALSGCLFKYQTKDRIVEGNFLSYRYERAINGSYSVLIIDLQPLACPGFIKTLPEGGVLFQEQRKAIPIMKPFASYGKLKKYYGSQARFQYEMQMEFRNRAKEIYTRGGISISDETLGEFAQKSFLPKKLVKPVLDFWVQENYLTRSDDGLYNIGSRESAARKMIEEAGKYEFEGAKAAKRRLEKQRKKIAGG